MKKRKPVSYHIPLFAGIVLMAGFGSKIATSLALSKSWAGSLLLPGYSVGLLLISRGMVAQLAAQVRDLRSKVEKLESTKC